MAVHAKTVSVSVNQDIQVRIAQRVSQAFKFKYDNHGDRRYVNTANGTQVTPAVITKVRNFIGP